MPGGKVFIHTGALMQLKSEAELMGLIGHEVSRPRGTIPQLSAHCQRHIIIQFKPRFTVRKCDC
jgi:predicted Zn-dependent protease